MYSPHGIKGQLTKFIAEGSLFQKIPLSQNMAEYNSELRLLFKALVADQSMPDKMRASLKQFIKSNAQISYDLIKENPLLRWVGYLPEGVHGYLKIVETTDRTAQEGLYIAMKATAAEFTRTLFKQTDESNYVFGTNIPNSRIPKEIDRVINALKEEKQTVARRSFSEPVRVASYYDTSMRDFQVQGNLHGVRSNLRQDASRKAPLPMVLQQSRVDLADFTDVMYTKLTKNGYRKAIKTGTAKVGKGIVKGTMIVGTGLGVSILILETLDYAFPRTSQAQSSEQPVALPATQILEHWNLFPRTTDASGQAEMPASPISKKTADAGIISIEDPTGNPIVAAEVLHLPDKLHGHYGGFIPFGYDLQDRNGALEGKLNFDKPVDNVTVVPLDKDMPVSFSSEDIALSFKPREFIYLPDNVDVTRIIQHGGSAPSRNALGALQFDVNHLPEHLVIIGTVQERQQAIPGSKMRILGQDSSLNYDPIVDVASAKLLSDTLKTDPELHALLATVASEPTQALTQTTELQTLWQQMYGLEQVMNHRYYSLKLTEEVEPGSYSGLTYLDTYGGFYCNTAGIITAQFAQLNGMPSFLRRGAVFIVNEKNELKNDGIYHQEPIFIGPGGFIIVHDNTPSPIRSPDRDDERRAQPTARPMKEQDPAQVRGVIFEALKDVREKQALEDKKAAEEVQRKLADAQEAANKAAEELKRKQMWEGIENTARKAAAPEYIIAALLLTAGALSTHPKSRKFIRDGIEESISRSRYELRQYRLNQLKKRLKNAEEVSLPNENHSPKQQVVGEPMADHTVDVVVHTKLNEVSPTPEKENPSLLVLQAEESAEIPTISEPETSIAESELILLLAGGLGIELAMDPDSEEEFSKHLQRVVHSIANLTTDDLALLQELAIGRLNENAVDVPDTLAPLVEMVDLRRWVETVLENEEKLRLPYSARSRGEARHNRAMRLLTTAITNAPENSVGKVVLSLVKNTFK